MHPLHNFWPLPVWLFQNRSQNLDADLLKWSMSVIKKSLSGTEVWKMNKLVWIKEWLKIVLGEKMSNRIICRQRNCHLLVACFSLCAYKKKAKRNSKCWLHLWNFSGFVSETFHNFQAVFVKTLPSQNTFYTRTPLNTSRCIQVKCILRPFSPHSH